MDQFKEPSKMSLEHTCSPKDSHDKMRYNSTGRKRKVRPQLALDVYESAIPLIRLNTELLIEMVEENNYQGCSEGSIHIFFIKQVLKVKRRPLRQQLTS